MAALRQRLSRVGTKSGGRLPFPIMAVGNALIGMQPQTVVPMLRIKSCKLLLNNNSSYRFGQRPPRQSMLPACSPLYPMASPSPCPNRPRTLSG